MKKIIYLLISLILVLNFTSCETYDDIDDIDPIDIDSTITIPSDSITIKFIHHSDSTFVAVDGYVDITTLYLKRFEHNGYFNDWAPDYINNTWIYNDDFYTKISKYQTKRWKYKKNELPNPLVLQYAYISPNNDLNIRSKLIDSTVYEMKKNEMIIKITKILPLF